MGHHIRAFAAQKSLHLAVINNVDRYVKPLLETDGRTERQTDKRTD